MKKFAFVLGVVCAVSVSAQAPSASDVTAWEKRAKGVTIVRDDWGFRTSTERPTPTSYSG